MNRKHDSRGYNERLFSGGLRRYLHLARFRWFRSEVVRHHCSANNVLELGCFDGKTIEYLPHRPHRYSGYDANWEGGLHLAKEKWADAPGISFHEASSPSEMEFDSGEIFDLAVSMETLEHLPDEMVGEYLEKISNHLDGYLFVTVPNEKGLVFLFKWLVKVIFIGDAQIYSWSELLNATIGRMEKVSRHEHKGFDYRKMIGEIDAHFDVIKVSGLPLGVLPCAFNFGIGIIAVSRNEQQ